MVKFAEAARRVREVGCDGVEVTASKGYIIHQFLNPFTNRRTDRYGGSVEARFQLLKEVVLAVRKRVGADFLFGVRLSAKDFNYLPVLNLRWPLVWPLRHYWMGNSLPTRRLEYGRGLKELGVDYLHIDSGFGFINPKGNPGKYPLDGLRIFANSTRHLSAKAKARAFVLCTIPSMLTRPFLGIGWKRRGCAQRRLRGRVQAQSRHRGDRERRLPYARGNRGRPRLAVRPRGDGPAAARES